MTDVNEGIEAAVPDQPVVTDPIVVYKGEEVPLSEIPARLEETEKNLLRDYHTKTQAIAEERRGLAESREEVIRDKQEILRQQSEVQEQVVAVQTDVARIQSDPYSQEVDPEVTKVIERQKLEATQPVSQPTTIPDPKVQQLSAEVANMQIERSREQMEGFLRDGKTYQFADRSAVLTELANFARINGRVAGSEEIRQMVQTSHNHTARFIKQQPAKKTITTQEVQKLPTAPTSATPDVGASPTPPGDEKVKVPTFNDAAGMDKLLTGYIEDAVKQREGG